MVMPFFHIQQTGNKIGDNGVISLGESLKTNKTLVTLNLCCESKWKRGERKMPINICVFPKGNLIGSAGAKAIGEALKVNTTLTRLYLGSQYKIINTETKEIKETRSITFFPKL